MCPPWFKRKFAICENPQTVDFAHTRGYSDSMNAANFATALRIILAPIFFIVFTTAAPDGTMGLIPSIIIIVLFIIIEISDFFDGALARKYGTVSDFGKLFDPFADSFARLTYFLSFVAAGIMPAWIFLLVLYRDVGVAFIRLLTMKKGIAMSAQLSGKIKAWVYAVAGGAGILLAGSRGFLPESITSIIGIVAGVSFWLCAATAVWTMIDYTFAYKRIAAPE